MKTGIENRHFIKKEYLIRAGENADDLYFITKGLAREYVLKGKQEITTDIISEGTVTGAASSFLGGGPSLYSIQAMEPVLVLAMSRKNLEKLYEAVSKWQKLGRLITTHFLLEQEKHILDNIRYSAKERFPQFQQQHTDLLQRVPQKYLASYLNIEPETFSRLKHLVPQKTRFFCTSKRGGEIFL
ncbi:MAG: Crp/Fnr family transcriptional regulator [Bacteroidota bacterium]|nr:Crp/Fnr family transcriptional regulator [Bacteroidota bacterium]